MTQENVSNQGKGAIFDLDGTLLDSMGVWDQVDVDFLAKRGFEVPDDYMQKVAAMQFRQIAEYTIARFNLSDTPGELMEEWDHMARVMYSTVVEAKPHAREYLAMLKASGAKLSVATSLPPILREPAMRHVGIFDYFDEVVECRRCGRYRQGQAGRVPAGRVEARHRADRLHRIRGSARRHALGQVRRHASVGHA